MIKDVTIGADPELFFEKDGEIISVEGLIGGTKKEPRPITDDGHSVQEDNIMAEFNIPPSNTRQDFIDHIEFVKGYLSLVANKNNAKLNFSASANIDRKYLKTKQALEFGCEPDFNFYSKRSNEKPSSRSTLRTCGGHIHIGYDNPTQKQSEMIIFAMDIALGLPSLELDLDDKRRSMYGKAGSFRFKEFGIEYRTLSTFWTASEELIGWAYDKVQYAIELINSGAIEKVKPYSKLIEKTINTNDRVMAQKLIEQIEKIQITNLTAA